MHTGSCGRVFGRVSVCGVPTDCWGIDVSTSVWPLQQVSTRLGYLCDNSSLRFIFSVTSSNKYLHYCFILLKFYVVFFCGKQKEKSCKKKHCSFFIWNLSRLRSFFTLKKCQKYVRGLITFSVISIILKILTLIKICFVKICRPNNKQLSIILIFALETCFCF